MSVENTGGPAFPTTQYANGISPSGHDNGMTLRDYFAAKAMQSYVARDVVSEAMAEGKLTTEKVCSACYEWADKMLKARES